MKKKQWLGVVGGAVVLLVVGSLIWQYLKTPPEDRPLKQFIQETDAEKRLSYADRYKPEETIVQLSSFEENNDVTWNGTGFYDNRVVFAGKTALSLTSTNREPGVAWAKDMAPLGKFANLEVEVNITDPEDLEMLLVYLGSPEAPHAYQFPISNLSKIDWNVVRMPQDKFVPEDSHKPLPWDQIARIEFNLVSRPGVTAIVNLDELRLEYTDDYLEEWNVSANSFLGIGQLRDQVHLMGRGIGAAVATWRDIPSVRDFVYRAKLIPLTDRRSGMFFRGDFRSGQGYVFWIGGVDEGTWGLMTRGTGVSDSLDNGEISNVSFRKNEPVWLEAQVNGEKIRLALSLDGEHFSPLTELTDTTFMEPGGLGIYVEGGGATLFDGFAYTRQ